MKTGLTKKQKIIEYYFNEADPIAEVCTHNTALKRRLLAYAEKHPDLCKLTDDDGQGGLRITEPYTDERRAAASEPAKKRKQFRYA